MCIPEPITGPGEAEIGLARPRSRDYSQSLGRKVKSVVEGEGGEWDAARAPFRGLIPPLPAVISVFPPVPAHVSPPVGRSPVEG